MNPQFAAELLKALMLQAVAIATPILLTAMVIGLAVSLFQSVTSIQEQTLTFVPKALAIVALLVLLALLAAFGLLFLPGLLALLLFLLLGPLQQQVEVILR